MKKEQIKKSLQEIYQYLDQMQIKGADNIFALSNALARIQYIFQEIDKEDGIIIDNTKEAKQ